MDKKLPSDFSKAVNILESWENSINDPERTRDFVDAIEVLNEYIIDDDYKSLHSYAKNIKRTYTRKLLEKLPSLSQMPINDWFEYLKILVLSVPGEVDEITSEHPLLKKNEEDFCSIWAAELISILKKIKK